MKYAAWLAISGILIGSLLVGLLPPLAVTGAAIAMGVPFRLSAAQSLLASIGISIAWFVASQVIDKTGRVLLDQSPRLLREVIINGASLVVLAAMYGVIVQSFLASLLMAFIVSCLYLAAEPLISRAAEATENVRTPGAVGVSEAERARLGERETSLSSELGGELGLGDSGEQVSAPVSRAPA